MDNASVALTAAVTLYTSLRNEQTPDDAKNVLGVADELKKWLDDNEDGNGEEEEDGQ